MKRMARSAIVECSARKLYALVEDIEAYPEFLPWCISTRVLARSPGRTRATLDIGMPGVQQSVSTDNRNRPGEAIDMLLLAGPFRHFSAAWRFIALGEHASRIEFEMAWEFGTVAPARLLEPLFKHIADTMVDAFTRRAEVVHGKNPG